MVFYNGNIPWNKGKHLSEEDRHKKSIAKMGTKNHQWKGDQVTKTSALHGWIRRHMPQPELCDWCWERPSLDLANITGNYTRDFNNWRYLCRRCHMISDGRIKNLRQYIENK